MPMIDVTAPAGAIADPHALAQSLAAELMRIERVPDIPLFRENTAAFVHELPSTHLADVNGGSTHVRVQVLTNAGALDRDQQLAVVDRFSALVAAASGGLVAWVLLTEAVPGGWGLAGHAHTNDELVAAARAQIADLQAANA